MNPSDDSLERLLKFAGQIPRDNGEVSLAPFGLETRVLAAWRGAAGTGLWNMGLLLRGLLLASVVTAFCLWPALEKKSTPDAEYLQLADSTLQVDNS
jgi:membrane protein implicated in regulation of membrane protease activity